MICCLSIWLHSCLHSNFLLLPSAHSGCIDYQLQSPLHVPAPGPLGALTDSASLQYNCSSPLTTAGSAHGAATHYMFCWIFWAYIFSPRFCYQHPPALVFLLSLYIICFTSSGAWASDTTEANLVISVSYQVHNKQLGWAQCKRERWGSLYQQILLEVFYFRDNTYKYCMITGQYVSNLFRPQCRSEWPGSFY